MLTSWRSLYLILGITFVLLFTGAHTNAADSEEGILVGRIAHVEGKLLRYVEEGKDWVVTGKDAPFGLEDALYSGDNAKAEFIMPNQTWLRVGENTQIQLIALNPDATTVDVASGLARLYNKSYDAVVKVTTPFGYVVAPGGAVVDLYVGDDSLEVIAVRGNVDFVHDATRARYEVREGDASIIADRSETARGNGTVDSIWDDWNGQRDNIWAQRLRNRGPSMEYLPEPIHDQAYALEENGRWERVYYEGDYRHMWRPTRVDPGWRPFTAGRWSVYYGDNCWIPDEPFGYVTHHYGSWVFVESFRTWYWLPPVTRVVADTPRFLIGFGWYPGRVGWIHSGPSIGWVPLAPDEVYYGYRPWGHRTVIVHQTTVINVNQTRYRYLDEAVIIHRDHLYRGSRYTPYVQRNISKATLLNTYKPATVLNNTVVNTFNTDKRRFAMSDAKVDRKPHSSVLNRINHNQQLVQDDERFNRERIQQDAAQVKNVSQPPLGTDVRAPMLTNKLVDANKTTKPLNTGSLKKKEIKPQERQRQLITGGEQRRGPHDQGETSQIRDRGKQDESRRMQTSRDARNQVMEQIEPRTQLQTENRQRVPRDQGAIKQPVGDKNTEQDSIRQIRSPREMQNQDVKRNPPEPLVPSEDRQRVPRESKTINQAGDTAAQQDSNRRIRSPREVQSPSETVSPGENRQQRAPREPGAINQTSDNAAQQDEKRRIRSPRDAQNQETEQKNSRENQMRQQEEGQRQQQQEIQRRQQEEGQRQQQQEIQRRQQEEVQRQQQQEIQRRQQEEGQRQQQQEIQRRQQEEGQRQQQQEIQRRQQEEGQRQQQQEIQRRQQEEGQRQQQQEIQRRQQEEGQRQQQQEIQRRQQEEVQRQQQQEIQRRQQEEVQRQQQQEIQRRQQEEVQRQQQQEIQRRQLEEQQRQQQQQLPNKKPKNQREEELQPGQPNPAQ